MKWAAASMRRSAASQRSRAVPASPAAAAMRASASRAKTSTGASSVSSGLVEDRHETFLGAWHLIRGVHGGQQALAERGLLSTAGFAVPRGRGFECRPRWRDLSERTQNPTQMDPGERRQPHVAGGLGLVDRELQGGRASVVVAGLALRSAKTRDLVRLGLLEAELSRSFRGATEVERRLRRTGAGAGPARRASLRRERAATGPRPSAASAGPGQRPRRCASWSPAEIAALAANSQFAAWSHGRSSVS